MKSNMSCLAMMRHDQTLSHIHRNRCLHSFSYYHYALIIETSQQHIKLYCSQEACWSTFAHCSFDSFTEWSSAESPPAAIELGPRSDAQNSLRLEGKTFHRLAGPPGTGKTHVACVSWHRMLLHAGTKLGWCRECIEEYLAKFIADSL